MTVAALARFEQGGETQDRPFGEPRSLPARGVAPTMPESLLPSSLRGMAVDLSERMQVPLEMVAAVLIVALSSVVGRKLAIHPKARDDWKVVPNLWGCLFAQPGMLKSPTLNAALRPLHALATEARQAHEAGAHAFSVQVESLEAREAALKDELKRAVRGQAERAQEDVAADLTAIRAEKEELEAGNSQKRYVVNDSTVEKLGELLRANPHGLLLLRDELSGWLRTLDRKDRGGDRQFYLESWSGDGRFVVDRIGRGTVEIPALCLSVIGGIQPSKLARVVTDALEGNDGADGLLQRFQILVWPEEQRGWQSVDRVPDQAARESVLAAFRKLDNIPCPDADEEVSALRFADEAQILFNAWLRELELRIRSDELAGSPAFVSHLAKYRSLMPSLALLFHLLEVDELDTPVSLDAARLAADWCGFLEMHVVKVYGSELKQDDISARAMLERIETGAVLSGMTLRDIYNHGWAGLKSADQVRQAAAVLEQYDLARIEVRRPTGGGRPSQVLVVNPAFSEDVE